MAVHHVLLAKLTIQHQLFPMSPILRSFVPGQAVENTIQVSTVGRSMKGIALADPLHVLTHLLFATCLFVLVETFLSLLIPGKLILKLKSCFPLRKLGSWNMFQGPTFRFSRLFQGSYLSLSTLVPLC